MKKFAIRAFHVLTTLCLIYLLVYVNLKPPDEKHEHGGKDLVVDALGNSRLMRGDTTVWRNSSGDTVALFIFENSNYLELESQLYISEPSAIGNAQLRLTTPSGGADPSIQFVTGDQNWTIAVDNSTGDSLIISNSLNPQTSARLVIDPDGNMYVLGTLPQININGSSGAARVGVDASDYGFLKLFNNSGINTVNFDLDGDDSYINTPLAVGKTSVSSGAMDVDGYVKRYTTTSMDIIALMPVNADSGAILDTTATIPHEVLNFYSDTDSTVASASWFAPPTFSSLDSVWIIYQSPTSESPDSTSWGIRGRSIGDGENRLVTLTTFGRDTVESTNTVGALCHATITGFSGISAYDWFDFQVFFDNTISNVVAGPTSAVAVIFFHR